MHSLMEVHQDNESRLSTRRQRLEILLRIVLRHIRALGLETTVRLHVGWWPVQGAPDAKNMIARPLSDLLPYIICVWFAK